MHDSNDCCQMGLFRRRHVNPFEAFWVGLGEVVGSEVALNELGLS